MGCRKDIRDMGESKNEKLNQHFVKWEEDQCREVEEFKKKGGDYYLKHYDNKKSNLRKLDTKKSFTIDGIVDAKAWESGKKILFILKEANLGKQLSKTKDGELLIGDEKFVDRFWFKHCVCKSEIDWRRGIFRRLKKIGIKHTDNNFSLLSTAYININKRGGLNYAREDIINSYYEKYKKYILEEIRIIEPEIIAICCGEQEYAKNLKEEINKPGWGENIKVELYHHPAMRRIKDEDYIKPIG